MRVVDGTGLAPARLHVEDAEHAALGVEERDRERNQRVLHPEPAGDRLSEREQHAAVRGELVPSGEARCPLLGRIGDLDVEDRRAVCRPDRRGLRLGASAGAQRGGDEEGSGADPGGTHPAQDRTARRLAPVQPVFAASA